MSIPGYVNKALQCFKRSNLKGADSPIIYVPPSYGRFQQEEEVMGVSSKKFYLMHHLSPSLQQSSRNYKRLSEFSYSTLEQLTPRYARHLIKSLYVRPNLLHLLKKRLNDSLNKHQDSLMQLCASAPAT